MPERRITQVASGIHHTFTNFSSERRLWTDSAGCCRPVGLVLHHGAAPRRAGAALLPPPTDIKRNSNITGTGSRLREAAGQFSRAKRSPRLPAAAQQYTPTTAEPATMRVSA